MTIFKTRTGHTNVFTMKAILTKFTDHRRTIWG